MNDQTTPDVLAVRSSRPDSAPDLPLILEQLQDQLDQLRATVETQQIVIETHEARLAALERR